MLVYMHKLYVMVVHLTLPSRYYHDRNWWRTKPRVSMNENGICTKDHVTSGETDGKSDTLIKGGGSSLWPYVPRVNLV